MEKHILKEESSTTGEWNDTKSNPAAAEYAISAIKLFFKNHNKRYDKRGGVRGVDEDWVNLADNSNPKKDTLYFFCEDKNDTYNFIIHASDLKNTKRFFELVNKKYNSNRSKYETLYSLFILFDKTNKELKMEERKDKEDLEKAKEYIDVIKEIFNNNNAYIFKNNQKSKGISDQDLNELKLNSKKIVQNFKSNKNLQTKFVFLLNDKFNEFLNIKNLNNNTILKKMMLFSMSNSIYKKFSKVYFEQRAFNKSHSIKKIYKHLIDKIYLLNWLVDFYNFTNILVYNNVIKNEKIEISVIGTYNNWDYVDNTERLNKLNRFLSNLDTLHPLPIVNWNKLKDLVKTSLAEKINSLTSQIGIPGDVESAKKDYNSWIDSYMSNSSGITIYDDKLKKQKKFYKDIPDFIYFYNFLLDRLKDYGKVKRTPAQEIDFNKEQIFKDTSVNVNDLSGYYKFIDYNTQEIKDFSGSGNITNSDLLKIGKNLKRIYTDYNQEADLKTNFYPKMLSKTINDLVIDYDSKVGRSISYDKYLEKWSGLDSKDIKTILDSTRPFNISKLDKNNPVEELNKRILLKLISMSILSSMFNFHKLLRDYIGSYKNISNSLDKNYKKFKEIVKADPKNIFSEEIPINFNSYLELMEERINEKISEQPVTRENKIKINTSFRLFKKKKSFSNPLTKGKTFKKNFEGLVGFNKFIFELGGFEYDSVSDDTVKIDNDTNTHAINKYGITNEEFSSVGNKKILKFSVNGVNGKIFKYTFNNSRNWSIVKNGDASTKQKAEKVSEVYAVISKRLNTLMKKGENVRKLKGKNWKLELIKASGDKQTTKTDSTKTKSPIKTSKDEEDITEPAKKPRSTVKTKTKATRVKRIINKSKKYLNNFSNVKVININK
jgi:hypothetical protein